MEDEKKTLKYLKSYNSVRSIEKVFSELKKYCAKHNVDFENAANRLRDAIGQQARSEVGKEHFIEYWNHLMLVRRATATPV